MEKLPIIFATFITDTEWLNKCAIPLSNSSKYFHPEIPFKIFDLEEIKKEEPEISIGDVKAVIGKTLSKDYQLVVIFDADSLITARLDEILKQDYEVAGVRNRSDHGSVHFADPAIFQIPNVCTMNQYMNAGLIAVNNPKFFEDWDALRHTRRFDLDQGTFNMVAYSGNYKLKMLDPPEVLYYYGVSNTYGNTTAWDSWKTIKLIDEKLFMKNKDGVNKQIKILHKAGSGRACLPGEKFSSSLFRPEVYEFLKKVIA